MLCYVCVWMTLRRFREAERARLTVLGARNEAWLFTTAGPQVSEKTDSMVCVPTGSVNPHP